jgi:hypothetical protein
LRTRRAELTIRTGCASAAALNKKLPVTRVIERADAGHQWVINSDVRVAA